MRLSRDLTTQCNLVVRGSPDTTGAAIIGNQSLKLQAASAPSCVKLSKLTVGAGSWPENICDAVPSAAMVSAQLLQSLFDYILHSRAKVCKELSQFQPAGVHPRYATNATNTCGAFRPTGRRRAIEEE